MFCSQCHQQKMVCQWDLVGVVGPWDLSASKQACKMAKKPILNVDVDKEVVGYAKTAASEVVA
jgi:hypothetical protein